MSGLVCDVRQIPPRLVGTTRRRSGGQARTRVARDDVGPTSARDVLHFLAQSGADAQVATVSDKIDPTKRQQGSQ